MNVGLSDVPPFSYSEGGELKGINVQILNQIEQRADLKFKYNLYPHERVAKLLTENSDLAIVFRVVCNRYKEIYEPQGTLYTTKPSIYLKKTINPKNTDIRVGRMIGTCNELINKYVQKEMIVNLTSMDQAIKMLKVNRLEGICGIKAVVDFSLKDHVELKKELSLYKTQTNTTDFDAVVCRKKSLPLEIKNKLDQAARKIKIPKI